MSTAARALPNLDRHLRWLIAFRLVMISSVLLSYLVFELSSRGELPEFNLLFVLVAATYIASIVHIGLLTMLAARPLWHAYVQFAAIACWLTASRGSVGVITGAPETVRSPST